MGHCRRWRRGQSQPPSRALRRIQLSGTTSFLFEQSDGRSPKPSGLAEREVLGGAKHSQTPPATTAAHEDTKEGPLSLCGIWSGRKDSNLRPPGPEAGNINDLRASPYDNKILARLRPGPYLDPKRRFFAPLDPGWPLLSTLVIPVLLRVRARSLRPFENLTKICCSDRISKSPYRGTSPQIGRRPGV